MTDTLDSTIDGFDVWNANPKSYSFLKDLDLDQDVIRRLSIHLDSIKAGNSEVYTSPLCKEVSPTAILESFDRLFDSNLKRMNSTLVDLEISNRSKFGPRSIALPWKDRKESIAKYFEGRPSNYPYIANPSYDEADISHSLRPIPLEKAVSLLKNSTNSGLPFYTRKSKVKDRLISNFVELSEREDPCILFTRTQESNKTRNVWGYPIVDTLMEMCYYAPILEYQKKLSWRAALRGPEEVDREVTRIMDSSKLRGNSLISIDFSSFDASVSINLIHRSFEYFKLLFQPKYWDDLDVLKVRFTTIPILTPSGVLRGCHGVPSGSTFTNEVDSLSQYFSAISSGLRVNRDFQIQGDDGLYSLPETDVPRLLDSFESSGLVVNRSKSYVSDSYCIYLQCLYHFDYRNLSNGVIGGIYPIYRALNRILFQERWSNFEDYGLRGQDYYSLRTISILENCKHHPLFREFVKFIFELDKYSLRYSKESLHKYCEMLMTGPGTGGFLVNQYGDDIRGISSFDTVKVLKELA